MSLLKGGGSFAELSGCLAPSMQMFNRLGGITTHKCESEPGIFSRHGGGGYDGVGNDILINTINNSAKEGRTESICKFACNNISLEAKKKNN